MHAQQSAAATTFLPSEFDAKDRMMQSWAERVAYLEQVQCSPCRFKLVRGESNFFTANGCCSGQ
jgi:hypothetical protein